ncbi:MAG: PQQ-binding-like beta-propeller repeat protein [Anaerolineales bacterium]
MTNPTDDPKNPNVNAASNSNAVGSISAGGDISGNIHIGNTGYTPEQVSILIKQIQSTFQPKPFDGRCPYKGLDVFEEEDAELFFGREKLVDDLVSRVKDSRTVFVTGPSGSGKSSLVRAGLIHALKQGAVKGSDRWLYATMKPGRDPIGELGRVVSSLASSTNPEDEIRAKAMKDETIFARWSEIVLREGRDKRLILFIDQFEEVFTQINNEEERVAFLNLLTHAATVENGRVIILFSMRSDFVSNCATYPQLNAILNQQFVQIGAMQPEELVSAIAQPALRVGLRIDPDLIAQIINEMKGEPGALPLMQFALKDLFDSQQEKSGVPALILNDYLQRGGIHKALERHADDSFAKLSKNEQELARSIFSGLIEIGRGTQDTKRTALFDELVPSNTKAAEVESIVQKLADARLITTDEVAGKDTVTISHEKLIDAWPWLKKLVNENRDVIALQNQIAGDAKEWEERKRDASYLYSGGRLAATQEKIKDLTLSKVAQEFVKAGKTRQQRNRQILMGTIGTVITLLMIAVLVFSQQSNTNAKLAQQSADVANTAQAAQATSQANADEAQKQANIAIARQLASQAQSIEVSNSSKQILSTLLSITSMNLFPTNEGSYFLMNKNDEALPVFYLSNYADIAFSKNSKFVVVGGQDKTIRVLDLVTGKEISSTTYDENLISVNFSSDSNYIISKTSNGTVHVWMINNGEKDVYTEKNVTSIAISNDSKYMVVGNQDKTIRVLETNSGKEIFHLKHAVMISSVAIDTDGKFIAAGGNDGSVCIWEFLIEREIACKSPTYYQVQSLSFSPSGNYVISLDEGGNQFYWNTTGEKEIIQLYNNFAFSFDDKYLAIIDGNTVRITALTTGVEITSMKHNGDINSVSFSSDSKHIASGSNDGTVRYWESFTGKEISRMTYIQPVTSVDISPDGKYVISGNMDGTARIWDAESGKEIARMSHESPTNYVAFNPDGNYVISESLNSAVIWRPAKGVEISNFLHNNKVRSVAFSPDGKYVLSGSEDSTASIWETTNGKERLHIHLDTPVYAAAFSRNGKFVAIGGSFKVLIYQFANGKEVFNRATDGDVYSVAFSNDSKYVAFVENGSTILIMEADSGKVTSTIQIKSDLVTSVAFSPNGKYLASGNDDTATIWDITTSKEILHMDHNDLVTSVDFSPDGKYLVSGSYDTTVRIWDTSSGEEVTSFKQETPVDDVTYSLDGNFVVTGSMDGTARIWKIETGKEIARMSQDGAVNSVAFSPDGKYVVSGDDNTARVWTWQSNDLITNACRTMTRNLTRAEWSQYIGDALPYQAVCPNLPIEAEVTSTPIPTSTP